MTIEVSDLYDAFFEIASIMWRTGRFADSRLGRPIYLGPDFTTLCDALQGDFFFEACARRLLTATGHKLNLCEISDRLRLHDADGSTLEGESSARYHFHAFDWGMPEDTDISNRVAAGDLTPRSRSDTRIFLHFDYSPPQPSDVAIHCDGD